MMLARVADALYWIGRYVERAEHMCRLSDVMLDASLDRTDGAGQVTRIVLSAVGDQDSVPAADPYRLALALALDRQDPGSIASSVAQARENARQVREQITTETWERLNLIYLRVTAPDAARTFNDDAGAFLHEVIADLHLFKGAADATMSHGEGWGFLMLGVYLERAQLIGRLLKVCFSAQGPLDDHIALVGALRMSCALEPYLRRFTADVQPGKVLDFLLLDEEFPRSMRFCTARIEEYLGIAARHAGVASNALPVRLAGRLRARLQYADMTELHGAGGLIDAVLDDCAALHQSIYDTFVAYPLETRLSA
ncbi:MULTISPECIES: alpha-E domain-containing protein [Phenylobacterium]|uniref:Alpha-E superfamily protein n=1 Tax=Phenylobacterium koreense TaxID=266125 RepID=A0ABV2EJQ9_9CAUL